MATNWVSTFWQLVNFDDPLNRWLDLEQPDLPIRIAVAEWILSVADDAYAGACRQPDVGVNYWLAKIPNTYRAGRAVVCTFRIDEETRTVTCDMIATLSMPLA